MKSPTCTFPPQPPYLVLTFNRPPLPSLLLRPLQRTPNHHLPLLRPLHGSLLAQQHRRPPRLAEFLHHRHRRHRRLQLRRPRGRALRVPRLLLVHHLQGRRLVDLSGEGMPIRGRRSHVVGRQRDGRRREEHVERRCLVQDRDDGCGECDEADDAVLGAVQGASDSEVSWSACSGSGAAGTGLTVEQ